MKLFKLFFLIILPGLVFANNCENCIAVVDVGSSGSRVHIYSATNKENNPQIIELWSKKINPGLATLTPNAANINPYLDKLFADSDQITPIPVYFYATGGMRFQSLSAQQKYFSIVGSWFANQTVWNLMEARTIKGSEEGVFGWLAINYQLKNLAGVQKVGVIDMGGASVQITFPIKAESTPTNNTQAITVNSKKLNLFSHSFLGLGQNEFSKQFYDFSPCLISNYQSTHTGDSYTCEQKLSSAMNYTHQVTETVQPILSTNKVTDWYVIGAPVELAKNPPFNFKEGIFTNQNLLEKANTAVCQQDWQNLVNAYPGNDYLFMDCLYPAYYYALMVDGYGLSPQENIHFFTNSNNNDWTMGVIISLQNSH